MQSFVYSFINSCISCFLPPPPILVSFVSDATGVYRNCGAGFTGERCQPNTSVIRTLFGETHPKYIQSARGEVCTCYSDGCNIVRFDEAHLPDLKQAMSSKDKVTHTISYLTTTSTIVNISTWSTGTIDSTWSTGSNISPASPGLGASTPSRGSGVYGELHNMFITAYAVCYIIIQ